MYLTKSTYPRNYNDSFMNLFQIPSNIFQSSYVSNSFAVSDTETHLIIEGEVPGLETSDIDVTVENNRLHIRVTSESDNVSKFVKRRGTVKESFKLPSGYGDDITATMVNGVLTVKVPKPEKAQPRKIEISG